MAYGDEEGQGGGFQGWQCGELMLAVQKEGQVRLLFSRGKGDNDEFCFRTTEFKVMWSEQQGESGPPGKKSGLERKV